MPFSADEAYEIGKEIGVDWDEVEFDSEALAMGMEVELEHGTELSEEVNVTEDDPEATAKIAWAHLMEAPNYYDLLLEMEELMEDVHETERERAAYKQPERKVDPSGKRKVQKPELSPELENIVFQYTDQLEAIIAQGMSANDAFKKIMPDLDDLEPDDLVNLLYENPHIGGRGSMQKFKEWLPALDIYDVIQKLLERHIWEAAVLWWGTRRTELQELEKMENQRAKQQDEKATKVERKQPQPAEDAVTTEHQRDDTPTKVLTGSARLAGEVGFVYRGHQYREAVIRNCEQRDMDPDRSAAEQKVCLFTRDGKELLGRHPDVKSAQEQEAAIHARGGSAENDMSKRQYISVDDIMEFYRDADEAEVAELVDWFNDEVWPGDAEGFLRDADRVLENHGVEALDLGPDAERWRLDYDEAVIAYYSNTGDSYHPTFLWDIDNQEMLFTGWADFFEQWERERQEELGDEYMSDEEFYGAAAKPETKTAKQDGWDKLPKGWTKESVLEFWDELTGERKHKVKACIKKMKDEKGIDDPGGFCASLADMIPEMKGWREEPRKSEAATDEIDDAPVVAKRQEEDLLDEDDGQLQDNLQELDESAPQDLGRNRDAMTAPKQADRMIRRWAQGLPRDMTGHASVWLYGLVAEDASNEEWLTVAEHEGLYIPAGQRDIPYIKEFLRDEMNDQLAGDLDDATEAGQVGNFVYAEQGGEWGLMYETMAVEDVIAAMGGKPPTKKAATPTPPPETIERDVRKNEARKTSRGPDHRPRGRDSRAPAVQLTQEIGKLPRERGKREPAKEEPEQEGWLKRSLRWLEQKSKEAAAPRSRWGRLRKADTRQAAKRSARQDPYRYDFSCGREFPFMLTILDARTDDVVFGVEAHKAEVIREEAEHQGYHNVPWDEAEQQWRRCGAATEAAARLAAPGQQFQYQSLEGGHKWDQQEFEALDHLHSLLARWDALSAEPSAAPREVLRLEDEIDDLANQLQDIDWPPMLHELFDHYDYDETAGEAERFADAKRLDKNNTSRHTRTKLAASCGCRKKESTNMERERKAETFRGFNLDMIPSVVEEALNEIRSDPENFDDMDQGFEYYAEDLVVASGRPEDYADALGIDQSDPEWQESVREQWEFEHIQDVEDEVNAKFAETMERENLPGGLALGSHEGSGDYGIIYFIDYDEAEQHGVVIPAEPARFAHTRTKIANDDEDKVAWKITKNHVGDRKVRTRNFEQHADRATEKFRMYDDDGELYYEGVATPETDFEPLEGYGMPNAGATEIRYFERGEWRTL